MCLWLQYYLLHMQAVPISFLHTWNSMLDRWLFHLFNHCWILREEFQELIDWMAIICLPISLNLYGFFWTILSNLSRICHFSIRFFCWLDGYSCLVMVRFSPLFFFIFARPTIQVFRAESAFYAISSLCLFLVIVRSTMMSSWISYQLKSARNSDCARNLYGHCSLWGLAVVAHCFISCLRHSPRLLFLIIKCLLICLL